MLSVSLFNVARYLMGWDGLDGLDGLDGWDGDKKCPLKFFILCRYIDKVSTYIYM